MTGPHIVDPNSGYEEPPTWDAYRAACAAIEKHRARAESAEAKLAEALRVIDTRTLAEGPS